MSKYLKTKPNSLESAVLEAVSPAQQAAIAIAKKEKGEKPKEEKTECPKCEGKGCDHCEGKGYHTAEELTAKQKKIDMNKDDKITGDDLAKLRAKGAKKEEVQESVQPSLAELAAKHISDMWAEASKSTKKEEEDPKAKKDAKTTMTGKPMSNVEINPKSEED